MIIEGNPIEVRAMQAYKEGDIDTAHGDHLPNCLKEDKVNPWNTD